MKKYLLLLFFLFLTFNLYGQSFSMISTSDPILEDIRYLSVVSGKSFLSFSPPISTDEIRLFLNSVDLEALSQGDRIVFDRISYKLMPPSPFLSWSHESSFLISMNIDLTLEAKVRFNDDISWDSQNSYPNQLIKIPLQLLFGNTFQLYIEPAFGLRPGMPNTDIFFTNIPLDSYHYNVEYSPFRSFFAAGGSCWNFKIGKDHLYWGSGRTGSMVFSNNTIFYDFAYLSFFNKYFKYSIIINHMPLYIYSPFKVNVFLIDDNSFKEPPQGWNEPENNTSVHRYFYLHRLDFNLLEKFTISLMEGVMVGNSPLELRYLNPLLVFHTVYAWTDYEKWEPNGGDMIGSLFSVEFNWNIFKSFSFYGQFILNQLTLPDEIKSDINQPPNGIGYLAGINYAHSFEKWNSIFFLEFIYTDPYLNILGSPYSSFIHQNIEYYLISHSRDTISLSAGADFFNESLLRLSGKFTCIISGEHNKNGLKWDWELTPEAFNEKTPSGIAENKYILSFGAGYKPYSWLELNTNISGIVSVNNAHFSGNIKTGGQASFSVNLRI